MIERKMIKSKIYHCCYEEGRLERCIDINHVLGIILFPIVWLGAIFYLIESFFKRTFYLTEREFYERKLKEAEKND